MQATPWSYRRFGGDGSRIGWLVLPEIASRSWAKSNIGSAPRVISSASLDAADVTESTPRADRGVTVRHADRQFSVLLVWAQTILLNEMMTHSRAEASEARRQLHQRVACSRRSRCARVG